MRSVDLPPVYRIRVRYGKTPTVLDIEKEVGRQLSQAYAGHTLSGKSIAITAGSRGIANYPRLLRAQVDWFRKNGANPFLVPAMGTHGGDSESRLCSVLSHSGITEASMGCPIRPCLETHVVGTVESDGPPLVVHCSKVAWEADFIHLSNRVKWHTDFEGRHESGLFKIGAIGLGQLNGAESYHSHVLHKGLGWAIDSATTLLINSGHVSGGLGFYENQLHQTAAIRGFSAAELDEGEAEMLTECKKLMARLPLPVVDLLYVRQGGKNISGTGLDTKVIQRSVYNVVPGERAWNLEAPPIWRIFLSSLTEASEGNAVGMGLTDGISERYHRQVNYKQTVLNAITGLSTAAAKTPVVFPNDRQGMMTLLATCPWRNTGPVLVCILDTLHLSEMLVSPGALELLQRDRFDIDVLDGPKDLFFDETGHLVLPF